VVAMVRVERARGRRRGVSKVLRRERERGGDLRMELGPRLGGKGTEEEEEEG